MVKRALDASALLAYLRREKGYGTVASALEEAFEKENSLLISSVNWGEVVYVLHQHVGAEKALQSVSLAESFPIDIVPVDKVFAERAAAFKAAGKLSYADSFAAALAQFSGGELLTCDRGFEKVKDQIHIVWI